MGSGLGRTMTRVWTGQPQPGPGLRPVLGVAGRAWDGGASSSGDIPVSQVFLIILQGVCVCGGVHVCACVSRAVFNDWKHVHPEGDRTRLTGSPSFLLSPPSGDKGQGSLCTSWPEMCPPTRLRVLAAPDASVWVCNYTTRVTLPDDGL